jgi:hypothetical protein
MYTLDANECIQVILTEAPLYICQRDLGKRTKGAWLNRREGATGTSTYSSTDRLQEAHMYRRRRKNFLKNTDSETSSKELLSVPPPALNTKDVQSKPDKHADLSGHV